MIILFQNESLVHSDIIFQDLVIQRFVHHNQSVLRGWLSLQHTDVGVVS